MISFIHVADVHFGVENYGQIDQETGIHSRLLDFYRAFNVCIDHALEKQVDFFLFVGDAYKTAHPTPTQQQLLLKSLLRLHKAGIPVILIIGNHDNPLSFGKSHSLDLFNELPVDGFYVVDTPKTIALPTAHGLINIVGIPWPTRNSLALSTKHMSSNAQEITAYISQAVAAIIASMASALDPTLPAVLASHLTVSSGIFSGSEKRAIYGTDPMLLPSQLAIEPFDYVALGHLHRHQNLNPESIPPVVYSGSIERVDFGERNEEKGFCLVKIHAKKKVEFTFVTVPTRPFIQIEVTITNLAHATEEITEELKKHTLNGAIVKILYTVPADSRVYIDLKKIQASCSEALHVIGVFPVRLNATSKIPRATITMDTNLGTMLRAYFDTKPELMQKKELLIGQALELEQEVIAQKEDEEMQQP